MSAPFVLEFCKYRSLCGTLCSQESVFAFRVKILFGAFLHTFRCGGGGRRRLAVVIKRGLAPYGCAESAKFSR